MSFSTLLLIALGLSTDAFGACVARGALLRPQARKRDVMRVSLLFGAFATIGPLIGWVIGNAYYALVEAYDHWIAFALLAVIGAKMIRDGWTGGEPEIVAHGYRLLVVVITAFAASIDAFAVGITLPAIRVNVFLAAAVIGSVTFLASVSGIFLGRHVGARTGRRAEIVGGLILIAIGVRILLDHIYWASDTR